MHTTATHTTTTGLKQTLVKTIRKKMTCIHPYILAKKIRFLLVFLFSMAISLFSAPGVQAQSLGTAGSTCVGGQMVFYLTSGCSGSVSWSINASNYTVISQSSSQMTVQWNSVQSSVRASAFCSSSGQTLYSPYVNISTPATAAVSVSPSSTSVCTGGSLTFTATPTNGGASPTYQWSVNGTPVSGANSASFTYSFTSAGSQTVSCTLYSSAASCSGTPTASSQASVNVSAPVAATITASGPTTINQGSSVTLTAPTGSGYAYQWFRDGVAIAGVTAATYSASVRGIYTVRLTVGSCVTTSAAISVTVLQPSNYNQIITNTVLVNGRTTEASLQNMTVTEREQQIAYFDGLGRPLQNVVTQGSPTQKDIITPMAYDGNNRQPKQFLPYTDGSNGYYKPDALGPTYQTSKQFGFYQSPVATNDGRVSDTAPFAETVFEASSLARVTEQGSVGALWQISTTRTQKVLTRTNLNSEIKIFNYTYATGFGNVSSPGYYNAGQLFVTEMTDEHGVKVLEFKDKEGLVVCKKVQQIITTPNPIVDNNWLITCYVYDDQRQLRMVIQPQGMAAHSGTGVLDDTFVRSWCFTYHYDSRGRMVEKRVPGAGAVFMVYGRRDELLLTQDARQRSVNEWSFTKYDGVGRMVLTGIYKPGTLVSHTDMQAQADGYAAPVPGRHFEERANANYATQCGYTLTQSFPAILTTRDRILTVNYYDDYNFDFSADNSADRSYQASGLSPEPVPFITSKGRATASRARRLDNDAWLWSVNFYDEKGRLIQSQADHHLSGQEVTTTVYDFAGRILSQRTVHNSSLSATVTVQKRFIYDHASRLRQAFQTINSEPEEKIADMTYNELGQLRSKRVGRPTTDATFLQQIDYRYNIRGWMTHINDLAFSQSGDLFGMELSYESGTDLSNNSLTGTPLAGGPQFNGNILAQKWRTATGTNNPTRMYRYSYDAVSRLTGAAYSQVGSVASENYSVSSITYDLNGNIIGMNRNGLSAYQTVNGNQLQPNFNLIDQLTYTYTGNRLVKVEDGATNQAGLAGDFQNGANLATEYTYDDVIVNGVADFGNGNLTSDLNKGINTVFYNHLNLPERIWMNASGSNRIEFVYLATGQKLRKLVYEANNLVDWTDYAGSIVYRRDKLESMPTQEGRVLNPQMIGNGSTTYVYEYHYKDHLGNLRLAFRLPIPPVAFKATMETVNAYKEDVTFTNVSNTRDLTKGYFSGSSAKVGGVNPIGPWKTLKVKSGDVVTAETYARYETAASGPGINISLYLTNPSSFKGGSESNRNPALLNLGLGLSPAANPSIGVPKAQLRYIFYDKDNKFVSAQSVPVASSSANTWVKLTLPQFTAAQDGYLQVLVVNESNVDVWFDDLVITQTEALTVQENHYDPWGLNLAGIETKGQPDFKGKFNGIEREDNLELNWDMAFFRSGDAQLGRWWQLDPKPNLSESAYTFMGNNAVRYSDPLGDTLRTDEDKRIADRIQKNIIATNKSLIKSIDKLRQQAAEARQDGKSQKATRLESRIAEKQSRIYTNVMTYNRIDAIRADQSQIFTFNVLAAGSTLGGTRLKTIDGQPTVEMSVTGDANAVHEINHAYEVAIAKLPGMNLVLDSPDNFTIRYTDRNDPQSVMIGSEVRAYRAQYAYDPSSMPNSMTTSTPTSVNGVTPFYVGGIYNLDRNGNKVPVYGDIADFIDLLLRLNPRRAF